MPQVPLEEWIERVKAGSDLASFPTDTVPALASRPDHGAILYAAKQRSPDKPLILMGATLDDLLPYVVGRPEEIEVWRQVSDHFWPGALTLVLPASDRVPLMMNPLQTGTIGIRAPAHPLARYLLSQSGPLATTSANRSGQPALTQMADIEAQFPQALTLTPGALQAIETRLGQITVEGSGTPSTVALWEEDGWRVLRQGSICLTP